MYDGARRLVEKTDITLLAIATSLNYELKVMASAIPRSYFCFTHHQGTTLTDYLHPIGQDLLIVTQDEEFCAIIDEAKQLGFETLIPADWASARQMNEGLYDGAAQFDIQPPCLKIGKQGDRESFIGILDNLIEFHERLEVYQRNVRQRN